MTADDVDRSGVRFPLAFGARSSRRCVLSELFPARRNISVSLTHPVAIDGQRTAVLSPVDQHVASPSGAPSEATAMVRKLCARADAQRRSTCSHRCAARSTPGRFARREHPATPAPPPAPPPPRRASTPPRRGDEVTCPAEVPHPRRPQRSPHLTARQTPVLFARAAGHDHHVEGLFRRAAKLEMTRAATDQQHGRNNGSHMWIG